MGVSVYRHRCSPSSSAPGFAGLAGAAYSYSEQYISPNTYNFELTILFLLAIIMGGRKSRTGALLGASIIVLLPKMLDDISTFRPDRWAWPSWSTGGQRDGDSQGRTRPPPRGGAGDRHDRLAAFAYWLEAVTDWRLTIFGAAISSSCTTCPTASWVSCATCSSPAAARRSPSSRTWSRSRKRCPTPPRARTRPCWRPRAC